QIVISGLGGQGVLFLTRVIAEAALRRGAAVLTAETHGMAQRGGSVVTHVRIGQGVPVHSPLVETGTADLILAFEILEAIRWLEYLKPGGQVVSNLQQIKPMPVVDGRMAYPTGIREKILAVCPKALFPDALKTAMECGSIRAVNMVLLGVAAARLPIPRDTWLHAVQAAVPESFAEINRRAFERGYAWSGVAAPA
ncbi:MAG TPA: indolepyruvate oxidoreductase subunit beta, partial [Clostridiales bacterium]|nr:indolepyruvate oxidoreductase subunit beta [Clostridiales bacterium]